MRRLCREVQDSITWQRFCRIPLGGRTPHPTTLMKITTRCGTDTVDQLNEVLLAKAAEAKVLKTTRVRADTTVVPANVKYPTDSGLLTKGISKISRTVQRIQAARSSSTRAPTRVTRPIQSTRSGKRLTKTSKVLLATSLTSSGVSSPKRSVGVAVEHETTNKAPTAIAGSPILNEPSFQRLS